MKKILFFAQGVTLAHTTRCYQLAESLDFNKYEAHFAGLLDNFSFFNNKNISYWPVSGISSKEFLENVYKGNPIYNRDTLKEAIQQDLALFDKIKPDLIVGDLRLSLMISARLVKVPYVNLNNAYWSPYAAIKHHPLPDVEPRRFFGRHISKFVFYFTENLFLNYHAKVYNELRGEYGFKKFKSFYEAYTEGDYVLYCDVPGLVQTHALPKNHRYIGILSWSPKVDAEESLRQISSAKPLVYLSLGSSGDTRILCRMIRVLRDEGFFTVVATAGKLKIDQSTDVFQADYLPGNLLSSRADFVVTNGGSPATYQALAEGRPVLGIASNMDQFMFMQCVERKKSGVCLDAGNFSERRFLNAVRKIKRNDLYVKNARKIQEEISLFPAEKNFKIFLEETLV